MRAMFDLIAGSRATAGGNHIRDGKGRLLVTKMLTEPKQRGPCFIVEFQVLTSEKVKVMALKFPAPGMALEIEPNAPGTSASLVIPLNDPQIKSGPGNAKAFILSLLGYTEAEVDGKPGSFQDATEQLCGKDQKGVGMVIDFETYRILNKAQTKELVLPRWTHVSPANGNSKAEIAERRAKITAAAA